MYTELAKFNKTGEIAMWNYAPHINENIYPGDCGQLMGSAGDFFPPGLDSDYVDMFFPDLCR